MYQPLAPCPSCHRHVRASAQACPFCGAGLSVVSTVPSASSRLARGALFAFASTLAACGGATEPDPVPGDTGSSVDAKGDDAKSDTRIEDTGNIAPPYGIPPMDSGVDDGTVSDTGDPMADYGAPPPPDAK